MIRLKLRHVLVSVALFSVLLSSLANASPSGSAKNDDPTEVVRAYITAEGKHDWEALSAIVSLDQAKMVKAFSTSKDQAGGAFRVKSAKLSDIKELPASYAPQHRDGLPKEIHVYYVAVNYRVDASDRDYRDGMNYRLVTVGQVDGAWRVIDFEVAPSAFVSAAGYGFGTAEETEVIASQQLLAASSLTAPSTIRVLIGTPYNCDVMYGEMGECMHTYPTSFLDYQKNTLPTEWGSLTAAENLKAGAIAVKMLAWYHTIYPKYPAYNADLSDAPAKSQAYVYGSSSSTYNSAINAVLNVAMVAQNDNFFEPQYRDAYLGDTTVVGPQSGGIMYQYGGQIFAGQNKSYQDILKYYYLNSTCLSPNGLYVSSLLFPTY